MGAAGEHIPCIIDVEASGFGPHSYPIEVGLALEDGSKYCSLIHPAEDWTHWDDGAEQVHHISREILASHGKPAWQIAADLNAILADKTVFTDGWVVDHPWLIKLFDKSQIRPSFRTSPLEMILTEPQMTVWHETKDRILDALNERRHRACFDAFVVQQTWVRTREETKTPLQA